MNVIKKFLLKRKQTHKFEIGDILYIGDKELLSSQPRNLYRVLTYEHPKPYYTIQCLQTGRTAYIAETIFTKHPKSEEIKNLDLPDEWLTELFTKAEPSQKEPKNTDKT